MDNNTPKLDKILESYSVPSFKGNYQASFWAKAAQLPSNSKRNLVRGLSMAGSMLTIVLMVGVFLPQQEKAANEQVEITAHLDELENFDVVNQMDYLELMDSVEAG